MNTVLQNLEPWCSMNEACVYLGITRDTCLAWIEKRGMPGVKVGRIWKFKISEIDEWMRAGAKIAVTPKRTFKLGELFCGPGGIACGAMRSHSLDGNLSVAHAWANDYDSDTCETYRKNICPDSPDSVLCCDVRNLDISELSKIDAFCYGFPCNSFSNVGKHKGFENEKFGQLYWYGIEVLKAHQPEWFVAENVSGIRSAGSGDFDIILNDMREAGYKLNVNLYKSEQYGIPQTRHTIIRSQLNFQKKQLISYIETKSKMMSTTTTKENFTSILKAICMTNSLFIVQPITRCGLLKIKCVQR